MRQVRVILHHEWRRIVTDRGAAVLVVVLACAVGYAVLHGASELRRDRATLEGFLAAEAAEVARQRSRDAAVIARIDHGEFSTLPEWNNDPAFTPIYADWEFRIHRSAVYPDSPLAFLALGQRDIYAAAYHPDEPGQFFKEVIPSAERDDNPLAVMIGHFDLAFVIQYLLPLFVIALSYDLLASEKESGVLALLLSQPVTVRRLIGAKLFVRASLIFGTSITAMAVSLAVSRIEGSGTSLLLGLYIAATAAYVAIWIGIALIVNARGKNGAANAVTLAVCWLAFVLLIPATARFSARVLSPVPPQSALRNAKREAIMRVGVDLYEQGVKELDDPRSLSSTIVARYLADHPDFTIASVPLPDQHFRWTFFDEVKNTTDPWRTRIHEQRFRLMLSARTEEIARLIRADQEQFTRQQARQRALFRRAAVCSPESLFEQAVTILAGTSAEQHDRFMQQVDANSVVWRTEFTRRSLTAELIRPEDFARFPYFVFQPETPWQTARRAAPWLLMLALFAVATLTIGVSGMLRYSVG
jgi:ABC-2 type transport system permease protein